MMGPERSERLCAVDVSLTVLICHIESHEKRLALSRFRFLALAAACLFSFLLDHWYSDKEGNKER